MPAAAKKTAKKKSGSRKPNWQRATFGWNGSAFIAEDKLFLDFEYSEERVSALKRFGGARFNKETKTWSLPLSAFDQLKESERFVGLRYYFNESHLEQSSEVLANDTQKAAAFVSLNPFIVPEDIFNLAVVEIEIHLNAERGLFIVRPKYRSTGERILKKLSWLLPSKREQGYLIQAHRVAELISELRDEKISFSITEEAGETLKRTSESRASIIAAGAGAPMDLAKSYLLPFVMHNEVDFKLCGWSPEHLQLFFPNTEGFPERKKLSEELSEADLSEAFIRADQAGIKIWLDNESKQILGDRLLELQESLKKGRADLIDRNEKYQSMTDFVLDDEVLGGRGLAEKLFPHQRVAVEWLTENNQAFLGDDMGLGKTVTVLSTFERLARAGEVDTLLVICPNSLKRNWIRESESWFPDRKMLLVPEGKSERPKFFRHLSMGARTCDGLVLNYESVRILSVLEELEKFCGNRKVFLCLDESQRVKNPKSKSFLALSKLAPLAIRKVLLSGTPIPRDLSDIWSQIFLLDGGERFGKNFYRWLAQVAELGNKYSEVAVKKFKPKEVKQIVSQVREILLRRKKEDVLSLPEKTFSTRDIELSGDQKKFFEEVRKELLLRVTSLTGDTFLREIQNVLEEYLRAVQVCSNPRLVDPSWIGEPAKFLECDEIVREVVEEGGGKLVIWSNYLLNIEELVKRYEHLGSRGFSGNVSPEDREKAVRDFQNGDEVRILVAVPAAGGVGITLTASQTAVYLDKTWNAEHFLQSVDRVHRIGQTGTVNIISLHASKVDELISWNLRRKEKVMRELLGDKNPKYVSEALSQDELRKALA